MVVIQQVLPLQLEAQDRQAVHHVVAHRLITVHQLTAVLQALQVVILQEVVHQEAVAVAQVVVQVVVRVPAVQAVADNRRYFV